MGRRKKQSGSRPSQLHTRTEDRSDNSSAGPACAYEMINIDGEKFTLSYESSTAGLRHIRDRHVSRNRTNDGADTASKFPENITDNELQDLIRKTIANGRWYPEKDAANGRSERVYLWDSRADEQASSMGLQQLCVITTNHSSGPNDIITTYPQYGTHIGIDGGSRGNTADLDIGKRIEQTIDAVAQRTRVITDTIDTINRNNFERHADLTSNTFESVRKPDADKAFLDNSSTSLANISADLHTSRRVLDTAETERKHATLNRDRKLTELLQYEIRTADERMQDVDRKLNDLANAITLGYTELTELQAGAGDGGGAPNTAPDTPRLEQLQISPSQQTSDTDIEKTRENIKIIKKNLSIINQYLDGFASKRSAERDRVEEAGEQYSGYMGDMTAIRFLEILTDSTNKIETLRDEQNRMLDSVMPVFTTTSQLASETFAERNSSYTNRMKNEISAIQRQLEQTGRKIDKDRKASEHKLILGDGSRDALSNMKANNCMNYDIITKDTNNDIVTFENKYSKPYDESEIKHTILNKILKYYRPLTDSRSDIKDEEKTMAGFASDMRKQSDQRVRHLTTTVWKQPEILLDAQTNIELGAGTRMNDARQDMQEVLELSHLLRDGEFARRQRDYTTKVVRMSDTMNSNIIKDSRDIRQRLIRAVPELAQQAGQNQ